MSKKVYVTRSVKNMKLKKPKKQKEFEICKNHWLLKWKNVELNAKLTEKISDVDKNELFSDNSNEKGDENDGKACAI